MIVDILVTCHNLLLDFRNKMNAQQRAQRADLVPLCTISDMAFKAKLQVDDMLGEYGAIVADKKDPKDTFVGWGSETSNAMFRPLHYGPTVTIGYKDKIDMTDLDIAQEVKDAATQYLAKLSFDIHAKAEEACNSLITSYCKLYKHMSGFANFTINSIYVYSKHYYVSDLTQCRLVRSKLLIILKPALRCTMAHKASGSFPWDKIMTLLNTRKRLL